MRTLDVIPGQGTQSSIIELKDGYGQTNLVIGAIDS